MVLLFALLKEHEGKILCIEEPELHLHSKFQKKLYDIIKKISENTSKQILLKHILQYLQVVEKMKQRISLINLNRYLR